ncbi:MAG: peptide ABC transporter substrate-binding protein [Oscillospiraceae bacterium]
MGKRQRRLLSLLLGVLLLFSGCDTGGGKGGEIYKSDLTSSISGLDPQFTVSAGEQAVILNIFEGLVRLTPEGEILPGAAESWDVSANGLTYTFHLREGMIWPGDSDKPEETSAPITADDFVFAFERVFGSPSSPHAEDFTAIQYGAEALAGKTSPKLIGVKAIDELTVEFTLIRKDPRFLEKLASPAAMPCNREFFAECRGRYGLSPELIRENGPFAVARWDDDRIALRQNTFYYNAEGVTALGADLYLGKDDPYKRYKSGETDLMLEPVVEKGAGGSADTHRATVWCLFLNRNDDTFGAPMLRQALAATVDREALSAVLTEGFETTDVLVPPAMTLGGKPLAEYAAFSSSVVYDPAAGEQLYRRGLELLGVERVAAATLFVPDTGGHDDFAGSLCQTWRDTLSLTVEVKRLPLAELEERYRTGDYQMLLLPVTPTTADPGEYLNSFPAVDAGGVYSRLLHEADEQTTLEGMAGKYGQAQNLLLEDAAIIPLYSQDRRYLFRQGIAGLQIFPFTSAVYYAEATG